MLPPNVHPGIGGSLGTSLAYKGGTCPSAPGGRGGALLGHLSSLALGQGHIDRELCEFLDTGQGGKAQGT